MRALLLMSLLLGFPVRLSADETPAPSYPILGFIDHGTLYLPTFRSDHGPLPATLYAYTGKTLVAAARDTSKKGFVAYTPDAAQEIPGSDVYGAMGAFLFRLSGPPTTYGGETLVFDRPLDVFPQGDSLVDRKSGTAWTTVVLASMEGLHRIIQTVEKGTCLRHIDYYFYAGYDTESSSDEEFDQALCGEKIEPFDAHP